MMWKPQFFRTTLKNGGYTNWSSVSLNYDFDLHKEIRLGIQG